MMKVLLNIELNGDFSIMILQNDLMIDQYNKRLWRSNLTKIHSRKKLPKEFVKTIQETESNLYKLELPLFSLEIFQWVAERSDKRIPILLLTEFSRTNFLHQLLWFLKKNSKEGNMGNFLF
jgi:hypothetical protein